MCHGSGGVSAHAPAAVPGLTPPAYERPVEGADAGAAPSAARDPRDGGRKRNLDYPPAPEPLAVPVPDNHTHLDFRDGLVAVDVSDALDAANAVGVSGVVQVGCDVESSRFAVEAAASDPRVLAAVALHPNDAPRYAARGGLEAALEEIDRLAAHPRVRAVGETGLDYFRTGPEGAGVQELSFRRHIEIARTRGKALQIHDRDAHADIVRILESEQLPEHVVFHCFSGDAELARICNRHGWHMSFSGTATFKNAQDLREALAVADPDLVMVETDAPFLTPHPYRGRPNASYLIPYTVRSMAEVLQEDLDTLCARIGATTRRVYGEF
ncbi:AraC family transcriptional regulator [Zafaria cholistanensis]|uniref:AraC family transcriptional regulator n=1 Tax=Zafaria cholistanensis TaxID=1682741 RepID=A0A5A7NPT0_9MICC|nr:TatD family hydrolase [Zafaria cholistanensis]GER22699.1 AraC family transcriptional regulator [Zafaria cholistanensis]